jgi:hypothetical protein
VPAELVESPLEPLVTEENFTPIYEYRELPGIRDLSRQGQDALLYRLQAEDVITMSTLQDVARYSDAQKAAGIPQDIGGSLFYIEVLDPEALRKVQIPGVTDELPTPRRPAGQVDEAVSAATDTSDDFEEWWEWTEQTLGNYTVEPNYYHGTKALSINVQGAETFSLSDQFGPGLYLTRSREAATRDARVMPASDMIVTGDMRPTLTNRGRVFPVYMRPEANVLMVSDLDDKAVRKVYRNLFRENLPEEFKQRFFNWSRNKPFDQWYHYIRSQFSKAFGQDSQYSYAEWVVENNRRLLASGIDAIEDNEGNLTVLNREVLRVFSSIADEQGAGSVAEGLLEKYRADLDLHRRLNNSTTKAMLEQDRLDIITYYRDQMADAVGSQEKRAIRSVEEMEKAEEFLAAEVRRERKALEASRIRESEIDSVRQGNRSARQSNDNFPCL